MILSYKILLIFLFSLAGSYGWAIRGTIIGGEKGSMFPGAIFGFAIAFIGTTSGNYDFIRLAAIGSLAMFHGGSCTYGETLNFVLRSNIRKEKEYYHKFKKGMLGVFINGGNWFSIAAAFMSIAIQNKTNYGNAEILGILISVPFIQYLGEKIFNSPYNKEKKIYPKIYFSVTRREEWGGNLLLIFALTIYTLCKGDYFTFLSLIIGYISGGIGFVLGLLLFYLNKTYQFFGKLEREGYIGNWKMMEFTIGFIGFLGTLTFFSAYTPNNENIRFIIEGFDTNLKNKNIYIIFILSLGLIYLIELLAANKLKINDHLFDILMRPLFSSLPMLIVLFADNNKTSLTTIMFLLNLVLVEKCIDKYFKKVPSKTLLTILLITWTIFVTVFSIYITYVSPIALILLITIPHQIVIWIKEFNICEIKNAKESDKGFLKYFGSNITCQIVEIIELAALITASEIVK